MMSTGLLNSTLEKVDSGRSAGTASGQGEIHSGELEHDREADMMVVAAETGVNQPGRSQN